MPNYVFNIADYQFAKKNFQQIAWRNFHIGRDDFLDYHCMPNPLLVKHSEEYVFWKKAFDEYFETNGCHYHVMVRLVNSFLITCATK